MPQADHTPTALGHLRVLDLSRVLAGPWAAQVLGDLGAEVVKVERPDSGDDTRHWGPPFLRAASGEEAEAAYFTACNRNKRSLTVDFSHPEGADLIRRLVPEFDVVIENFKVGDLAKYELDYASLSALHPGLVYCSITGFGQDGPYASRPGYDFLIQAMGGLMSITGQPDGVPGGGPVKVGVAVTDLFTGMYAAVSILAAISHRERTGQGQHIDCSLLDTQVAMLANQAANWLVGGEEPTRMGNNHPNVVPYRGYAVRDGHVIVAVGNDKQFARLCEVLEEEALATDPRFRSNADRVRNREELDAALGALLAGWPRAALIERLESVGVPCGPINALADVFADEQVRARGLEVAMTRDDGTPIRTLAFPARLSRTPANYRRAPPSLGADTDEILSSFLGIGDAELDALRRGRVIG
jgi:crotonobetainyl-CoA:carnitine CoA-transferase CaiB-like acyl-CoA transferase